jgi:hypothetical protein
MSTGEEIPMNEKNCHHSPRATRAALGLKLQALGLLAPIREKVKIAQKKIKHNPLDKLQDAFITILAGEPAEVIRQLHLPAHTIDNQDDKRGGTVEVKIKESKQRIGINN